MTTTTLAQDRFAHPIQAAALGTVQKVSFNTSGSAATANGVAADTSIVRLLADVDCYVAMSAAPTAAATSMRLSGGIPEYFRVVSGWKVAALGVVSAGTLCVTEMQ